MSYTMCWARTVISVWVILWMTAVPLVHVHPEWDHRHGDSNHAHGGIIHTVFSSDLACEYARHHDSAASGEIRKSFSLVTPSTHLLNHPEIGFLLASSSDRWAGKPTLDSVLSYEQATESVFYPDSFPRSSEENLSPLPSLLSRDIPCRAPPDRFA